jgi:hypothetical protein
VPAPAGSAVPRIIRAMATPTVTTWIDRTGPAVREALVMLDSQACTRFESDPPMGS